MPKFREKQPVAEIDAVQWRGDNRDEVCAWLDACPNVRYRFDEAGDLILTWNYGTRRDRDVGVGCWIYDSDDNIYIVKNDEFLADYEHVKTKFEIRVDSANARVADLIDYVDRRLDLALKAPRMWGSLESTELQVLQLLEFRALALGAATTDVTPSYFKFVEEKVTGAIPTTLASQLPHDRPAPEREKLVLGLLSEFVARNREVGVVSTPISRGAEIVDQPPPMDRLGAEPIWDMVIVDMQRRYKSTTPASRSITARVIEDMHERDRVGRERYGKPLTADNGRDQLVDAYQEILDASVYTRAAMAEGTLVPEAVYNNLLDSLVTIRRLIDRRAEMVALVGGAE